MTTTRSTPPIDEAAQRAEQERIAELIRVRHARERAEREAFWAKQTPEDLLRMCIEESRKDCDPVTAAFLGLSVPMWIHEMRLWSGERRESKARALGEHLAESQALVSDDNQTGRVGRRDRGKFAASFNAVAQGLACLAYCPGGITFAGHHWEAR